MDKDVQDVWLQSNGKIEEGIISDAGEENKIYYLVSNLQ